MKRNKIILTIAAVAICLGFLLTGTLRAENSEKDKVKPEFSGSFMFGYRFVDLGDNSMESKYKEDINLEKGPRLFSFKLHYAPTGDLNKYLDSLDLRIYNLGGDPFESFGLDAVKRGKYQFRYDRKKSEYFYSDKLKAGDLHTFDFERIHDSGMLKLWIAKDAHFYVNFDRYTKKGNSVTSYDINRLDIEFEKPIDEKSNEISFGADYSSCLFGIVVEEKILDYKNVNSLFLPGYVDGGENASYPSSMLYFTLSQPYDIKSNTHTAKLTLTPFKSLMIRGNAQIVDQRTNIQYSETAEGVDYLGETFQYAYQGTGEFKTKIYNYDADLTFILSNKLAIVGAARYNKYDQKKGDFTVDGETENIFLKYEIGAFEGGLQFQPTSKFGITVGYRGETRDIKVPDNDPKIEEENLTAKRTGLFGNLKWVLSKTFNFTADYQFGSTDNPFTLISPSTFHRFRLNAKYNLKKFYATVSYLFNKSISDVEELGTETRSWEATKNQTNIRLGYHGKSLMFWTGYSYTKNTREGARVIYYPPGWSGAAGSFDWDILFSGKSQLFDVYLAYNIDKAWGIGSYINSYRNKGSWELSRFVWKSFLKYRFDCGLMGELGYRIVDFKEKLYGYNNYKVNIFEISLGYQW